MNDRTTKLSDTYIECYSGTLALQTQITMGITYEVAEKYLKLSRKISWLLDETTPEFWFDEELEGIQAAVHDCYQIGQDVREWLQMLSEE
tara:strand:- start:81 stop:350 length:270 start_codon:yes stop_codon:yes gene_type:complete